MSSAEDDKVLSALIMDVPKKDGKANDIFGVANDKDVVNMMNCNDLGVNDSSSSSPMGAVKSLAKDVRTSFPVRKTILASLGLSLSSMLTFFWIKVAPLQLTVGIGSVSVWVLSWVENWCVMKFSHNGKEQWNVTTDFMII